MHDVLNAKLLYTSPTRRTEGEGTVRPGPFHVLLFRSGEQFFLFTLLKVPPFLSRSSGPTGAGSYRGTLTGVPSGVYPDLDRERSGKIG